MESNKIKKILREKIYIKFILVGILNTFVGYLIFIGFALTNINTTYVLFLSYVCGIIFSFNTYGNLVFNEMSTNSAIRFLLYNVFTYSINLQLIYLICPYTGRIIAMGLLLIPISIINFFAHRYYIYR
jgi:putative flippase GtrA